MEPLNIRDQFTLTRAIEKLVRPESFMGQTIAPLVPSNARKFKMSIREADQPFGIGQFKAPNSDTPIADIKQNLNDTTMTYISAVDLEEMVVIEETDQLESADALVQMNKIDEIISMGRMLQLRNERLTEWMRWETFKNNLTIQYGEGPALTVDSYGTYGSTHVITAPGANYRTADWGDPANSKVLDDLTAWNDLIEADSGFLATHIWMSRKTFRKFQKSSQFAEFLTFVDRQFRLVSESDIKQLVDIPNWHIYEGSYKDNTGNLVKYLPEDFVLLHSDPVIDGVRIAETYDCPVVRFVDGRLVVARNPGMSAELMVDGIKKQEFMRVSTARMTHLVFPENFIWTYIGA